MRLPMMAIAYLGAVCPCLADVGELAPPPKAKVVPVAETLHGTTVLDPYRWMESGGADYDRWLRAQAEFARHWLDELPGRDEIHASIERRSGSTGALGDVQQRKGLLFLDRRDPGAQLSRLYVRPIAGGSERLLFDPATLDAPDSKANAINYWEASPDGRHVYVGVSPSGSELSTLHVIDVGSSRLLSEEIPLAIFNYSPEVPGGIYPQWLPDSTGFFYNRLRDGATPGTQELYLNSRLFLHKVGTPVANDVLVMQAGYDKAVPLVDIAIPLVVAQPGSRHAVLLLPEGVQRAMTLYVAPLDEAVTGHARWKRIARNEDLVEGFALSGDRLYLLRRDRPRGRVVLTSAETPSLETAREVVAEGGSIIEKIIATTDGLYLIDRASSGAAIRLLGFDGRVERVSLPFEGATYYAFGTPAAPGLIVSLENSVTPDTRLAARGTTVADLGIAPSIPYSTAAYVSESGMAAARDGVRVPVTIVRHRDTSKNGRRPVLLDAYGAYGISSDAYFYPRLFAYLDAGGVYAIAHVRGGGELGSDWWLAGKGSTKPNTWRDAIDSGLWLIDDGWTRRGCITLWGTSAGGITVGRAITERPELWAGGIASVGVMNPLRSEFTANGELNIPEFGSVKDEAGFRALLAMDAYQAVRDGVVYPPMLVTAGANDPRVEAWEPAKFAARLQAAASGRPVIFKVDFDQGHGIGSSREQLDLNATDVAAFAFWAASAECKAGAAQARADVRSNSTD